MLAKRAKAMERSRRASATVGTCLEFNSPPFPPQTTIKATLDIWSSQVLIESTPMPDANMDAGGVCSTHVHRHYLVPPHCHQSISIRHGMVTIGKLIWEVHGWLVHVAIHCSSVARVQWGLSPGRQGVLSISCSGRYIDAIQKRKGNVPYCRRHGREPRPVRRYCH